MALAALMFGTGGEGTCSGSQMHRFVLHGGIDSVVVNARVKLACNVLVCGTNEGAPASAARCTGLSWLVGSL
jgi:hypothetical protein